MTPSRRSVLLPAALAVLVAGLSPALADSDELPPLPPVACPTDDGSPRLGPGTTKHVFDAPAAAAPELSATYEQTGDLVRPFRSAVFDYTLDLAPAAGAAVTVTLSWPTVAASDYDVSVLDTRSGEVLGSSLKQNATDGAGEQTVVELAHCQEITVAVRNWAGVPVAEKLTLELAVAPGEQLLACAAGDPAPQCAGRAEGEPPAASGPETRTRLYLDATAPGNAASVPGSGTAGQQGSPVGPRMTTTRPTAGTPNAHARAAGFRDQYKNLLLPWWETTLATPRPVVGDATALVWVSSPTLAQGGTLYVDLYLDGGLASSVAVPGKLVGRDPTPVRVTFRGLESVDPVSLVGLQVGTTPAVSSGGAGNPADAEDTVWFGSVQFPSRVTLP